MSEAKDGMMYECEVKVPYQRSHGIEYGWKMTPVDHTADTDLVRCMHCEGAVSIYRKRKHDGPADHVQHRERQDSENCKGGSYFKGVHSTSTRPVR